MNLKQARAAVDTYRDHLIAECPADGPADWAPSEQEQRSHLSYMLDRMTEMLDEVEDLDSAGRDFTEVWEKFNRWLGFMQGSFWTQGDFTLNDMRGHNTSCLQSS
jgi:hypothetical protein